MVVSLKEEIEKAALDFANEIRVDLQGREPLEALPKGVRGDPHCCPIATAIDSEFKSRVGSSIATFLTKTKTKKRRRSLPAAVQEFVFLFDRGNLPHLIDKDAEKLSHLRRDLRRAKGNLRYYKRMVSKYGMTQYDSSIREHEKRVKTLEAKIAKLEA